MRRKRSNARLPLSAADPRVRVLQNPCNMGVSAARNLGLDHAGGAGPVNDPPLKGQLQIYASITKRKLKQILKR